MRLKELHLCDWRNYRHTTCEFHPGVNLLVGDNAQGKTNLLEAIVYLSQGQSFRTRTGAELVRIGAEFAEISAKIDSAQREQRLRAVLFSGRRSRQLYVNEVKKKSAAEISGILPVVLFCPEDLGVLRAGSQARRRMIDRTLCQLRPVYASALQEYGRCLEQKSRILKDWQWQPGLLEILPEYNEQMARYGATIIYYRARYIKALEEAAQSCHKEFSGGRELLNLEYQTVSTIEDPFAPPETLYGWLKAHQASHARAEQETGQCLSGPHKDDLNAMLDGMSIKSFGSQGQTRTAAISIKLSERELLHRLLEEEPILLLDDVLSELDAGRQDFVLNRLGQGQVFITCCEKDRLSSIGHAYVVENGKINKTGDGSLS